jgi:hypothetical protein
VTAFDQCFLFGRHFAGGIEDCDRQADAGFKGIFVNIGDYPADQWLTIRQRALNEGMACGPWLRTQAPDGGFSEQRLQHLIEIADEWRSPLIVNCEKELDGTGSDYTKLIAQAVGDRDAALSVEATPFASVDWGPVAYLPVLPQLNLESGHTDIQAVAPLWRSWGFRCVYPTFGTYGGRLPTDYRLQAPYSLYSADDVGGDYEAWRPTSSGYQGCTDNPDSGGDMETIGPQHGFDAMLGWMQKPPGTPIPQRGKGYDPANIDTWPWPDKVTRAWKIMAANNDELAKKEAV